MFRYQKENATSILNFDIKNPRCILFIEVVSPGKELIQVVPDHQRGKDEKLFWVSASEAKGRYFMYKYEVNKHEYLCEIVLAYSEQR